MTLRLLSAMAAILLSNRGAKANQVASCALTVKCSSFRFCFFSKYLWYHESENQAGAYSSCQNFCPICEQQTVTPDLIRGPAPAFAGVTSSRTDPGLESVFRRNDEERDIILGTRCTIHSQSDQKIPPNRNRSLTSGFRLV